MNKISSDNVTAIGLYTGTKGKQGCTCNCLGCCLGAYGDHNSDYQGNESQLQEMIRLLPRLEKALIFGNPDISIDTEFCNKVAYTLQQRGVIVAFNTSGVGGKKVLETLLNGLNYNMVRFIDFSLDTLDECKLSLLKGINYSLETIIEGIEYCNSIGITAGVKPTIWTVNMNDDWEQYRQFLKRINVSRIKFHFGSLEGVNDKVAHVPESKILEIKARFKDVGIIPQLLLTGEEFNAYSHGFKPRCFGTGPLSVFFEREGIKATFCTSYSAVHSGFTTELRDNNLAIIPRCDKKCPVSHNSLGFESDELHAVCRYYAFNPQLNQFCI